MSTPDSPAIIQASAYTATDDIALDAATRSGRRQRGLLLAATGAVALLAVTLLLLPREAPRHRLPAAATAAPSVAHEPLAPVRERFEPGARERSRDHLGATLERLEALSRRNAEQWARGDMHEIAASIAAGEKAYRETRYARADARYADADKRIAKLEARLPAIAAAQVEAGQLALARGDAAAATAAFEDALTLEAENPLARAGLARAATLDHVLALVAQGVGYERMQDLDKALGAYREALSIDAEAPGASSGVERIEIKRRSERFRAFMSSGFKALGERAFEQAKSAFEKARKIEPRNAEVLAALVDVDSAQIAHKIDKALKAAGRARQQEQWLQAAAYFDAALKLDGNLSDARQSQQQARTRAALDKALRGHLADTSTLTQAQNHDRARETLERARSETERGPRLSEQIRTLSRALTLARTPVEITFVSNVLTRVAIEGVTSFEPFERRSTKLMPGDYIGVGVCGDAPPVRVEFTVSHDAPPVPIQLACPQN